jgi:uncharacterized protein YbaR (Trm112 family)
MHRSLLDLLVCPECRVGFELVAHVQTDEQVESGFLRCPRCGLTIPILDGFVLFTEPLARTDDVSAPTLARMAAHLFGSTAEFDDYRRDKRRRGVIESYAAFAPFNESTRAIEPVLPHAIGGLRDGDAILDAWNRTGWSGEWLAGRFPRQRVVAVWEGNSSVLGYRGFRHLLGSAQRAPNLDLVFCALDKPLPFRDGAFGLVHAYDCLHRYGLNPFAGECLRVARGDAAIVFPHVHLSNSEPEPYFERGGRHLHGREYRAWLDRVAANGRRGYVLSEATLFDGPDVAEWIDDPDTSHYNGFVAILPTSAPTPVAVNAAQGAQRFVVSPLFRFNLARGASHVAPAQFDGAVGHLLQRHPIYCARLPQTPVELSEPAVLALLLASVGLSEDEIVATGASQAGAVRTMLRELADRELLRSAAISPAAHRLQRFHANQWPARESGVLAEFWSRVAGCAHEMLILADGDGLGGADLGRFVAAFAASLRELGLSAGDRIAVQSRAHPLLLFAAVAAASCGLRVALVAPGDAIDPTTKLLLHGDGEDAPAGIPVLPLGLEGQNPSLATLLAESTAAFDSWRADDAGLLEFELAEGRAQCRLADLVDAIESLAAQIERPLWLFDGCSAFGDLIRCLAAWCGGEAIRALAGDAPD